MRRFALLVMVCALLPRRSYAQELCQPVLGQPDTFVCPGDATCVQGYCLPPGSRLLPVAPAFDPEEQFESGLRMRTTGIVLTVAGAGLLATSFYLFLEALGHAWACDSSVNGRADSGAHNPCLNAGVFTILGAGAALGVGIPFIAVGQHRMNRAAAWGYQPVSITPFIAPEAGGAIAGVRLATF
jgi:hypothetical protein